MARSETNITGDFPWNLSKCVTFLHRSRSKFMNEKLKEWGFSGSMYMILLYVNASPGTSQDDIVSTLYIDKCNVTRRTNRLVELGYISREVSLQDRRKNCLYLTEGGKAAVPVIRSYLSQWSKNISLPLTDEERESLMSLLVKVTEPESKK